MHLSIQEKEICFYHTFLPMISASVPAGSAPIRAPTARRDPTHEPCSSDTSMGESAAWRAGNDGELQPIIVPPAKTISVAKKTKHKQQMVNCHD